MSCIFITSQFGGTSTWWRRQTSSNGCPCWELNLRHTDSVSWVTHSAWSKVPNCIMLWHRLYCAIAHIVSISLHKTTTLTRVQSCVKFSPRSCVKLLRKVISCTSQRFSQWLKSGLCGDQSVWRKWCLVLLELLFYNVWWILALSYWSMPVTSGKKKRKKLIKKPGHSVYSGRQLTSFIGT